LPSVVHILTATDFPSQEYESFKHFEPFKHLNQDFGALLSPFAPEGFLFSMRGLLSISTQELIPLLETTFL
jgi:hypothetical protein